VTVQASAYRGPSVVPTVLTVFALLLVVTVGAAIDLSAQAEGRITMWTFGLAIITAMIRSDN
jgi:hypothetical protein